MLLSQRKYAEHRKAAGLRGGTLAAVQKAIASGRITLQDGQIDAEAADAAWSETTNPVKQRQSAEEPEAKSGSVAKQQLELLEEKTLTARVKRLQLEGEVIRVDQAEEAYGEAIDTAKALLLRLPDDLAEQLAASKEPAECRSILAHGIEGALRGVTQAA